MFLKTLVLGHGNKYKKEDVRCSPIDVDEWYNDPFISVDDLPEIKPDILCHLSKNKLWTFARDNSYDRIIDCTGGALLYHHDHFDEKNMTRFYLEIQRILAPYGIFYATRRTGWVFQKDDKGKLKLLDIISKPKLLRRPISVDRINKLQNHPFVKNGIYTSDEVIELEYLRKEFDEKKQKYMKWNCNICKTNCTSLKLHNDHLQTDVHMINRLLKKKELLYMTSKQLREEYDTINICKILEQEETFGMCL